MIVERNREPHPTSSTSVRQEPRPDAGGRLLYIGNPPYVRHHQVSGEWKGWLARTAEGDGAGSEHAGRGHSLPASSN